jgi:hypothetical protein
MLDLFSSNPAFSITSLTMALNRFPFQPGRIGELALYNERRLSTISTVIEIMNNRLALIPSVPRGSPPTANVEDRRQLVPFLVPHFPLRDTIMADSLQGVRAFGTEDQLTPVMQKVDERLASMGRRHDVTLEWLRLGGVKGLIVTRVDPVTGAPLTSIDLFAAFGLVPPPVLAWPIRIPPGTPALDNIAYAGPLTQLIQDLTRMIANELGAGGFSHIHGLAGSEFMDCFTKHPEIRQSYINTPQASGLRDPTWMRVVAHRELIIEEYRGQVGNVPFVLPNQCHFFPVGVPDLFIEAYAPADYVETVNTVALPRYAKQRILDYDKGVELETQQNVLPICTIPMVLRTAELQDYVP